MPASTKKPSVCAVVLNWNNPQDTVRCLNSLYPFAVRREIILIVVDNASTDDSIERLSHWGETHFRVWSGGSSDNGSWSATEIGWDFLLIANSLNCGYAAGNNVAISRAIQRVGIEYIWILNNDTVVDEAGLGHLLDCASRFPDVGIFGSTIVDKSSPNRVQCAGGCRYYPALSIVRHIYAGQDLGSVLQREANFRIDYISGAAMFCRTAVFRKAGFLDDRFFLYYEELDFANRVNTAGYTLRWCKESLVYHKGTNRASEPNSWDGTDAIWNRNYHENLSTLLYTRKHHPNLIPLVAVLRFLIKSLLYVARGRITLFGALFKAYWDAFLSDPNAYDRPPVSSRAVKMGACP